MTKRFLPLPFALALVALVVAGCGGGTSVAKLDRTDVAVVGDEHEERQNSHLLHRSAPARLPGGRPA